MWIYEDKVIDKIPENAVGFVYIIKRNNMIEDPSSPIYYIGKKNFYLKNKKESDWKKYYSSSNWLKEDIKKYGEESFTREIIHICYSKSEMTYKEVLEQLNNNVLQINDDIMRKKFYNLNIMGKFFNNEYFTKSDIKRIKKYINTGAEDYERICVTDGVRTKYINQLVQDVDIWLCDNPDWYLGTSFKSHNKGMILITNGENGIYVDSEDVDVFIIENEEWYIGSPSRGKFKVVNNGLITKRISNDEVNEFLEENPDWESGNIKTGRDKEIKIFHKFENLTLYIKESKKEDYLLSGWSLSKGVERGQYIWINKNGINEKINKNELSNYKNNGWNKGRINDYTKNKVWINNGQKNKLVDKFSELECGWEYGIKRHNTSSKLLNSVKVFNIYSKEIKYIKSELLNEFLLNNCDWKSGQGYNTSANTVFAIDMRTDKKVKVSTEEYKNNKYYTSAKTKKVKIKQRSKIIFVGYLDMFIEENPNYDKKFFQKILRENKNGGKLYSQKGKNMFMNELELSIQYLK